VTRRLAACAWCLATGVAACLTERSRPAPPTLAVGLNKTLVRSRSAPPDTLVVNVRAEDSDGIDSVWVQLDSQPPIGADGMLDPVLEGAFGIIVPPGLALGTVLPVRVQARDVTGFRSERDTAVTVGP
jgi:hypothetical protein